MYGVFLFVCFDFLKYIFFLEIQGKPQSGNHAAHFLHVEVIAMIKDCDFIDVVSSGFINVT